MKLRPFNNNIFIVKRSKTTDLEVPDSAVQVGAYRGIVITGKDYGCPRESDIDMAGKEVFFDGSKAFRLSTSEGEMYAVHSNNILAEIINE